MREYIVVGNFADNFKTEGKPVANPKMAVEYKDLPDKFQNVLKDMGIRKHVTVEIGVKHSMPPVFSDNAVLTYYAFMPDGTVKRKNGTYGGVSPWNSKQQNQINRGGTVNNLPPDIQVMRVCTSYKNNSVTIYVHPDFMAKALPDLGQDELAWEMKVVLVATRSLKSSYAGVKDYRKYEAIRETGISAVDFDTARQDCIEAGYLRKNRAITAAGRNAIADMGIMGLYALRREDAQ